MKETNPPTGSAVVGYARTSTADQKAGLADQIAELKQAGCTKVFSEQVSGFDAKRPELKAAIDYLREGDHFVVTRPDRLARSTSDLLAIVTGFKERGVRVRILSMDIDTGSPTGQLLLTLMAGIAEFERSLMLERQRAGIAAAKAAGKYKGKPQTLHLKADEVRSLKAQGVSPTEIARRVGIGRASVYRLLAASGP